MVPTALERAGDFSQSSPLPTDPLTRQPFPDGKIPLTRFDPTARNILNTFIPAANTTGNVYQANVPNRFNSDEFLIKIGHNLTARHLLTLSTVVCTTVKLASTQRQSERDLYHLPVHSESVLDDLHPQLRWAPESTADLAGRPRIEIRDSGSQATPADCGYWILHARPDYFRTGGGQQLLLLPGFRQPHA